MQKQQKLTHFDQENGLKPLFWPLFGLNWTHFRASEFFFGTLTTIDILILGYNIEIQQNLMHFEQEMTKNLILAPF